MSMNAPIGGEVPEWTLGNRLWRARTHAQLTQQELATKLGVGLRVVKEGEADKRGPKRWVVLAWAMVCGVDASWLETGERSGRDDGPGQDTSVSRCIPIDAARTRRQADRTLRKTA
jgi:transcriptional regulator with XRE-family HTH domain